VVILGKVCISSITTPRYYIDSYTSVSGSIRKYAVKKVIRQEYVILYARALHYVLCYVILGYSMEFSRDKLCIKIYTHSTLP
jgi:hypothetical protein